MPPFPSGWQLWAALAAFFAAVTALLAKVGVDGIPSNLATFVRTVVVLALLAVVVSVTGEWRSLPEISNRSLSFLVLSGIATGISWLCYFRALQLGPVSGVAPID